MHWRCSTTWKSVSGTTMPTLTSDLTPSPDVPAGLPDVAALTRMANAFFTALPEAAPAQERAPSPSRSPRELTLADSDAMRNTRAATTTGAGTPTPGTGTTAGAIPQGMAPV